MRRGYKIYAAHHRIEMPVEMASLKCQPSSINQSSARNNNDGAAFMGLTHGAMIMLFVYKMKFPEQCSFCRPIRMVRC
uniref:Uncharacterized protein n=1 Tax=Cyprinus carpio TaxID=7962 RepID=A0A8C1UHM8_CYPCA